MSHKKPISTALTGKISIIKKISIADCFQEVSGKTVFRVDHFMRINNFPDEIRADVIETVREMLPDVDII